MFQDLLEISKQAIDRFDAEEMGLIDTASHKAVGGLAQRQDNIECCRCHQRQDHTWIRLFESERLSGACHRPQCGVVKQNHNSGHLDWLEGALALERLGENFERKVLVCKRG